MAAVVEAEGSRGTESWLSLGEACRLLGVDESTLRRWADAGRVRTFRTPGGHRRFAASELQGMTGGQGRDGAPSQEVGQLAISRIRRGLHRGREHEADWYTTVSEESRQRLRPLGRHLMSLVSDYVSRRSRKAVLLEEARDTGQVYGRELAASGLRLAQAVEAFTFFRRSLDQAAREAARRAGLSAEAALERQEQVMGLADQVLVGIVEGYERAPARAHPEAVPGAD